MKFFVWKEKSLSFRDFRKRERERNSMILFYQESLIYYSVLKNNINFTYKIVKITSTTIGDAPDDI